MATALSDRRRENPDSVCNLLYPALRILSQKYGMEFYLKPDWTYGEVSLASEHGSVVVWRYGMDDWKRKWASRVEELARLNVAKWREIGEIQLYALMSEPTE